MADQAKSEQTRAEHATAELIEAKQAAAEQAAVVVATARQGRQRQHSGRHSTVACSGRYNHSRQPYRLSAHNCMRSLSLSLTTGKQSNN